MSPLFEWSLFLFAAILVALPALYSHFRLRQTENKKRQDVDREYGSPERASYAKTGSEYARFFLRDDSPPKIAMPRPKGLISVEEAMLVKDRDVLLRHVSFKIDPGSSLAIIGPKASGKTSLLKSIVGLEKLTSGVVRIDGAAVDNYSNEQKLQFFGYLPQQADLAAATVAENIASLDISINEPSVVDAAKKAGAHDAINALRDGYNTQINREPYKISGGQLQSVSLARALYNGPALVVLDDPSANMDSESETGLIEAMQQLRRENTTLIMVSHKVRLVRECSHVLVLVSGRVHRFGTTEEVLDELDANRKSDPSAKAFSLSLVA